MAVNRDTDEHLRAAVRQAAPSSSWSEIAAALGVSKQAAHQRFKAYAKAAVAEIRTEHRAMKRTRRDGDADQAAKTRTRRDDEAAHLRTTARAQGSDLAPTRAPPLGHAVLPHVASDNHQDRPTAAASLAIWMQNSCASQSPCPGPLTQTCSRARTCICAQLARRPAMRADRGFRVVELGPRARRRLIRAIPREHGVRRTSAL
jgi:hypothetical protein